LHWQTLIGLLDPVEEARKAFNAIDTNHNGYIDVQELHQVAKAASKQQEHDFCFKLSTDSVVTTGYRTP
jgi:Ca2+-binding EF-hand superfamily protein